MRVIVQPFFMDAAPSGMIVISAAKVIVASARRARDAASSASTALSAAPTQFASSACTSRAGSVPPTPGEKAPNVPNARDLFFTAALDEVKDCQVVVVCVDAPDTAASTASTDSSLLDASLFSGGGDADTELGGQMAGTVGGLATAMSA